MSSGRRKGTSAPNCKLMSLISSESVLTIVLSINEVCFAVFILCAIKGIPCKSTMFFLGMDLDPPLAGMIANVVNSFIFKYLINLRQLVKLVYLSSQVCLMVYQLFAICYLEIAHSQVFYMQRQQE